MEATAENKTEVIEVSTPETITEPSAPSRTELKEKGWTAAELDSAEKRGMIQKQEKKEEPKAQVKADAKEEPKAEEGKDTKAEVKEERRSPSSLPDFTITDPAKEKVFLDTFGPGTPQRAMYFRMKNERQSRQAAESRVRELEARIESLQAKPEKKMEVDEEGNEIDPDDKPMTPKMYREMLQREAEERAKQDRELNERAHRVTSAIKDQEEYVRSIYPDFDEKVKLAAEVMQNLDSLIPEKWRQGEAIELIKQLHARSRNAHEYEIDSLTPAMIAYKIGEFHPNKGKPTNGTKAENHNDGNLDRPDTKANGSLTPEQMKRIEQNTQRRASSASIPGSGGKRTISVDDVELKDLNAMSASERMKFKASHPERYAKLLRG